MPDDLQLVSADSLPSYASWYSVRRWGHYPPSPYNWCHGRDDVLYYRSATFGTNRIIIDDSTVDYPPPLSTTTYPSDDPSGTGPTGRYDSNDLWLEIELDTNVTGYVDLILHGATNGYWQILSKTNLLETKPWSFEQIFFDDGTTNELFYNRIPDDMPPINFFRAVGGKNVASITVDRYTYIAIEPDAGGNGGQSAQFTVTLRDTPTNEVTVLYSVTGTAVPGLDYSNYPGTITTNFIGSVTIPANFSSQVVTVHPFHDPKLDFDEPAIFTVILTNDYVVDPFNYVVTNIIKDNFGGTNIFSVVATNLPNPVGIDYSSAQQAFLLPINYIDNDPSFGILHTNAVLSNWSALAGINAGSEIRITTVKVTRDGLTAGDMLFGNGNPGGIGWLSADGTSYNLNWAAITNEGNLIEGIYIDQTSVWSNDVLAVTGADDALTGTNLNVWRVHLRTNAQLVASIPGAQHLEGVLTLPNDTRYGPWAGKLLTADEFNHVIYSVDRGGAVSNYFLGIDADQFTLIQTNQDLYCVAFAGPDSEILKLSKGYFTNYVGDVLVEQAGENGAAPVLFILHWNGSTFESHGIPLRDFLNNNDYLEKSTFAPINMPPLQ